MKKILLSISVMLFVATGCFSVYGKTTSLSDISKVSIKFNQPGAAYLSGERGGVFLKLKDTTLKNVAGTIEILDFEGNNSVGKRSFVLKSAKDSLYYPFVLDELGYYYIRVGLPDASNNKMSYVEEGFGVIPDVALKAQDWDSPFGVSAHYQRYKDWRIADIQRKLGIAWTRDEAEWKNTANEGYTIDPYLDYLESHNLCWLPLFDYVNANNGVQGEDGVWRWNDDIATLTKYVRAHKGRLHVYESQNEPNNFGGWTQRWPDPENQPFQPRAWGKQFTDLLKQMHDSINAVDSTIKFMWPGEELWIEHFAGKWGAAPYIDITVIHPYLHTPHIYPESETFAQGKYDEHFKFLEKLGVPTEMWVTEIGWSTFDKPETPNRNYLPVNEYEQAAYLVRSCLTHLYRGASKFFWYEMVEEPFGDENPESHFGLVRYNDMLTVKPVAVAYANMVDNYRHVSPVGEYKGTEGTFGFAYHDADNRPQLVVWRYSDSGIENIPLKYTKEITLTDIFGRSSKIAVKDGVAKIELDIAPLTIRGIDQRDFEGLYLSK